MKDDVLLKQLEDKYRKFQREYSPVCSNFLDMAQQSQAAAFVRAHRGEGVFLYGGYEAAERKKVFFLPDYMGVGDEEELGCLLRGPETEEGPAQEEESAGREDVKYARKDCAEADELTALSYEPAASKGRAEADELTPLSYEPAASKDRAETDGLTARGEKQTTTSDTTAVRKDCAETDELTARKDCAAWESAPEYAPLAVLEITPRAKDAKLRHSDYLGSLMALGIKREKIGDILVLDSAQTSGAAQTRPRSGASAKASAQIIVAEEIAAYLAENYTQVGRTPIETRLLPLSALKAGLVRKERRKASVASPRLDNLVSAIFGVSRKEAAEAINGGLVFVNSLEIKKTDFSLRGGEKLVLRGRGKAVYLGESGTSKKGKSHVEFDRFL